MHERKLGDTGTGRAGGRAAWLEHHEDTLESESRSSGTKLAPPPQQEGLHLNSIPRVISSPFPDGLNPAPRRVLGCRQLAFSEASWLSRQPHPRLPGTRAQPLLPENRAVLEHASKRGSDGRLACIHIQ